MERITIKNRFLSSFYAAGAALSTLSAPVICFLIIKFMNVNPYMRIPFDLKQFAPIAIGVTLAAAFAGFILGVNRMCTMFYYLWAIQKPSNITITMSLWASVITIGIFSILVHRNAL